MATQVGTSSTNKFSNIMRQLNSSKQANLKGEYTGKIDAVSPLIHC